MPRDVPSYPIAPVLEALGAEQVPRVHTGFAKILCPFHPDTTPSASVGRYSFICWACGRKGDAIKLLREEELLNFEDAVSRAEEITGGTNSRVAQQGAGSRSLLDL